MTITDYQLPYCTITGTFLTVDADSADEDSFPDVQPLNGTITFAPTTNAGRVDDAFAQILPVTVRVFGGRIVDDEDLPGVRILATDANIGVADWAWRASFKFDSLSLDPLTFKAPRDTTVNLTSGLVPIKSQPYQIVEGASIVDAEEDGAGKIRFALSDGTFTRWIDIPNGEKGEKGDPGVKGDRGADGASATLAMGSVTAGATADAWMTGTPLARELHLSLPRGLKGDKGDKGDPGAKGETGAVPTASDYLVVGPGRPDAPTTTGLSSAQIAALPVGCEYRSTDGASVGAWVWRKRPTGWVVTSGDTGWVDRTATVNGRSGGTFKVRRTESSVFAAFDDLQFESLTSGNPAVKLPSGFQVTGVTYLGAVLALSGGTVAGGSYARIDFIGWDTIRFPSATSALRLRDFMVLPPSTDPWPTTLTI